MNLTKPMITAAVFICSAILFLPGQLSVLADQGAASGSSVTSTGSSENRSKLQQDANLQYDHERKEIEQQQEEERRKQDQQRAPDPPPKSPVAPIRPSSPSATPLPSGN